MSYSKIPTEIKKQNSTSVETEANTKIDETEKLLKTNSEALKTTLNTEALKTQKALDKSKASNEVEALINTESKKNKEDLKALDSKDLEKNRKSESQNVKVKVIKAGDGTEEYEVDLNWSVEHFKGKISDVELVKDCVIIFLGRFLKNSETLATSGIVDGASVHMMIKTPHRQNETRSQNAPPQQFTDLEAGLTEELRDFSSESDYDESVVSWGSYTDFVVGFALGFFFGIIMVVWTWNPSSPRLQKMGIMIGILAHVVISYSDSINNYTNQTRYHDDHFHSPSKEKGP